MMSTNIDAKAKSFEIAALQKEIEFYSNLIKSHENNSKNAVPKSVCSHVVKSEPALNTRTVKQNKYQTCGFSILKSQQSKTITASAYNKRFTRIYSSKVPITIPSKVFVNNSSAHTRTVIPPVPNCTQKKCVLKQSSKQSYFSSPKHSLRTTTLVLNCSEKKKKLVDVNPASVSNSQKLISEITELTKKLKQTSQAFSSTNNSKNSAVNQKKCDLKFIKRSDNSFLPKATVVKKECMKPTLIKNKLQRKSNVESSKSIIEHAEIPIVKCLKSNINQPKMQLMQRQINEKSNMKKNSAQVKLLNSSKTKVPTDLSKVALQSQISNILSKQKLLLSHCSLKTPRGVLKSPNVKKSNTPFKKIASKYCVINKKLQNVSKNKDIKTPNRNWCKNSKKFITPILKSPKRIQKPCSSKFKIDNRIKILAKSTTEEKPLQQSIPIKNRKLIDTLKADSSILSNCNLKQIRRKNFKSSFDMDLILELAAEKKFKNNIHSTPMNRNMLLCRVYKSRKAIVNKNMASPQVKMAKLIKTKYFTLNKRTLNEKHYAAKMFTPPKSFKGRHFQKKIQMKSFYPYRQNRKYQVQNYKRGLMRWHKQNYRSTQRRYSQRRLSYRRKFQSYNMKASTPVSKVLANRVLHHSINRILSASLKKKVSKVNQYCMFYNRFGRCNRGIKCQFKHDPSKIAVCTRFLRGTCKAENCPFSHEINPGKMAICSFFLSGVCSNLNCPYRHELLSPNAKLCTDFVHGYCPLGKDCKKAHILVCPQYIQGQCDKGKACAFPHPPPKEKKISCEEPEPSPNQLESEEITEKVARYFQPVDEKDSSVVCSTVIPVQRKHLPEQPSFIALND